MRARCPCTMLQVGPGRWEALSTGYIAPDPHCQQCGGTGELLAAVILPDPAHVEVFWVGRCAVCGTGNGAHFQKHGAPSPLEIEDERRWPPCCINDDCPSKVAIWIPEESIVAVWLAICSLCDSVHSCNYLQREIDAPPTMVDQPRYCSQPDCGRELMMWVPAD